MEGLNHYYPAFLDLRGRRVLVVGGGLVAVRKIDGLLKCACHIKVVAPEIRPEIEAQPFELVRRVYEPADLEGACLVFAATARNVTPEVRQVKVSMSSACANTLEPSGK